MTIEVRDMVCAAMRAMMIGVLSARDERAAILG